MIDYPEFELLLKSKDPSNVDTVTEYFSETVMKHSDALLGYSEKHLENHADAFDALQEMFVAALQDLALQTAGGTPKFVYQGTSEKDLIGYVYLRLGGSYEKDMRRSTAHRKIRDQRKKHDSDLYEDCEHLAGDEDPEGEYVGSEINSVMHSALNSIDKPEHQLGISLHEGYFGLGVKSKPADLEKVAIKFKVKRRNVDQIVRRFESVNKLTSLKLDAKQVGFVVGTSASNFRKIKKRFHDQVDLYQRPDSG